MPLSPIVCWLFVGLTCLLFSSANWLDATDETDLPVIYVIYGKIPHYLLINIELASRNNNVIVISNGEGNHELPSANNATTATTISNNSSSSSRQSDPKYRVTYVDIRLYTDSANEYSKHYTHLSPDHSDGRRKHELRCFQRWFVLKEFMMKNNISRSFFGDGDSSVFMNIKSAIRHREHCSAIINIDAQQHDLYWCAAGEASVWTIAAIVDFCSFTLEMYQTKDNILRIKAAGRTSVVDMSLLWLWYVSRQNAASAGWDTARPFFSRNPKDSVKQLEEYRKRSDEAYMFSRKLPLPVYDSSKLLLSFASSPSLLAQFPSLSSLQICNGMDVVNRTVFDHIGGWRSGKNQSLNIFGKQTRLNCREAGEYLESSIMSLKRLKMY